MHTESPGDAAWMASSMAVAFWARRIASVANTLTWSEGTPKSSTAIALNRARVCETSLMVSSGKVNADELLRASNSEIGARSR